MRTVTKKLTTAAVCTALCVIMCVATAYLPLSIMPLYLAAFCIYMSCKRAGIFYGVLCAAASVGLMFAMTGLSVKWFFFLLMFMPYGIVAYFIDRLTYFKIRTAVVRAVAVILFFNLTFGCVYLVATRVVTVGIDLDISNWVVRLGGYALLALVGTVLFLPLDFILSGLAPIVLKRIPAISTRKRSDDTAAVNNGKSADTSNDTPDPEYDIFGYEIRNDGKTDDGENDSDGD